MQKVSTFPQEIHRRSTEDPQEIYRRSTRDPQEIYKRSTAGEAGEGWWRLGEAGGGCRDAGWRPGQRCSQKQGGGFSFTSWTSTKPVFVKLCFGCDRMIAAISALARSITGQLSMSIFSAAANQHLRVMQLRSMSILSCHWSRTTAEMQLYLRRDN